MIPFRRVCGRRPPVRVQERGFQARGQPATVAHALLKSRACTHQVQDALPLTHCPPTPHQAHRPPQGSLARTLSQPPPAPSAAKPWLLPSSPRARPLGAAMWLPLFPAMSPHTRLSAIQTLERAALYRYAFYSNKSALPSIHPLFLMNTRSAGTLKGT